MFDIFANTIEFRISAVYIGRVPLAEHDSTPPCIANRAVGNVTVGGTNRLKNNEKLLPLIKSHLTVIHAKRSRE